MCWPVGDIGVERCGRRRDGDVEESVKSGEDEGRDVEYEGPVKRELEHLVWIAEVVAPNLKRWSPLDWRQLLAKVVERRPRGCWNLL